MQASIRHSSGALFVGVGVLVFLMLVVFIAAVHGDPALTHDQAMAAIQSMAVQYQANHPDTSFVDAELYVSAERVAALSYILATEPTVQIPQLVKAIQGSDLYLTWQPPFLEVTIPPRAVGLQAPIDYKIKMPEDVSKYFVPPPDYTWAWILGSVATAAALTGGLLLGHALR